MLSDILLSRLYQGKSVTKGGDIFGNGPQITHDTIMSTHPHSLVKIVVSDADIIAVHALGNMQVSCICCCQARFGILAPKKVDCVNVTILLCQVAKVSFESRLRCLRTRDLDSLTKCL